MKKETTERASLRFKALRLFSDDLFSFLKGYRFAATKWGLSTIPASADNPENWHTLVTADPENWHTLATADPENWHTLATAIPQNWHTLAEFATVIRNRVELGAINQNRVSNMELCCALIDGLVVKPGQVFSFRKITGEPTPDRGFLAGPMIVGGTLSSTAGGGLCQITTTIFNTALLAGLKILEKHNHSIDIWGEHRFISLGRDAICVYGRKDLKFRNTLPGNILIKIHVDHTTKQVVCRIFAVIQRKCTVEITSRVIRELQPKTDPRKLPEDGWQPVTGWIVETQRRLKDDRGRERITYRKREVYKPGWKKSRM